MKNPNPYRGFRYPAELIQHAVWLFHCFSLSLRDAELSLAARGIVGQKSKLQHQGMCCENALLGVNLSK